MSDFQIEGKVALITGGASGIGLRYAKQLLRNGLKAVTLADLNPQFGENALKEIDSEFGPNRAIFVTTDVTNLENLEDAFKKTVAEFKNLDIVINNAGILNDSVWQKEIAVNVVKNCLSDKNGTIHGILLALDTYLPKYKSGPVGVIVNVSSVVGLEESESLPIYCGTKFAVIGLTISFGHEVHFQRTGVKVVAICPGVTDTPLMRETEGKTLGGPYQELLDTRIEVNANSATPLYIFQDAQEVAISLVDVIKNAKTGTVWVSADGKPHFEYHVAKRETFAPK